jgi:polar amino acid transport system permease protein
MNYRFQFSDVLHYWPELVNGLGATMLFATIAMAVAVVIGIIFAIIGRSQRRSLQLLSRAYVEFIRNTPLLVLMFILYFGLPNIGMMMSPTQAAVVGLSMYHGAYASETFRAAFGSIHRSQFEAGASIGMTRLQVYYHLIAKQAFEKVYPILVIKYCHIVLGTSIASAIGAEELAAKAEHVTSMTFRGLEVYIVIGVVYFVLVWLIRAFLSFVRWVIFPYRRDALGAIYK